ncbi:hypothetical protein AAMO2058_000267300 [Amorphochlora amoebiformis]
MGGLGTDREGKRHMGLTPIFKELVSRSRFSEGPSILSYGGDQLDTQKAIPNDSPQISPSAKFCDELTQRLTGAKLSELNLKRLVNMRTKRNAVRKIGISAALTHKIYRTRKLRLRELPVNPHSNTWRAKVKQILVYQQVVPFTEHRFMRQVPMWCVNDDDKLCYEMQDITPKEWIDARKIEHRFMLLRPGTVIIRNEDDSREIRVRIERRNQASRRKLQLNLKIHPKPPVRMGSIYDFKGKQKVHREDFKSLIIPTFSITQWAWHSVSELYRWALAGI